MQPDLAEPGVGVALDCIDAKQDRPAGNCQTGRNVELMWLRGSLLGSARVGVLAMECAGKVVPAFSARCCRR
jgi:hypothetical protein